MVDGIDAAEAAYRKARLPGAAARLSPEARHRQPSDDLRPELFRDPGHRRADRVQRRAARVAEGRRRAGQRGARHRRRRPCLTMPSRRPVSIPTRRCSSTARSRSTARPSAPCSAPSGSPRPTCRSWASSSASTRRRSSSTGRNGRRHPNGARGLLGVTVIAEQPEKWMATAEKYFGKGSARKTPIGVEVDTGTQPILYLDRAGLPGALSRHEPGAADRSSGAALDPGREPCRLRGAAREERRRVA